MIAALALLIWYATSRSRVLDLDVRSPLRVHEGLHPGPLASCAAPRQGVSAPCNDANFIVPSAAGTVGRGRPMLAAVWLRNQPNMVVVGIPGSGQASVLVAGQEDVVFRAHASDGASAGPMAPACRLPARVLIPTPFRANPHRTAPTRSISVKSAVWPGNAAVGQALPDGERRGAAGRTYTLGDHG